MTIADYDGEGKISISIFSENYGQYVDLSFSEERNPNIWVEEILGIKDRWESLPRKIMTALQDVNEMK